MLCALRGLWFTAGLAVPPDEDIIRDLGFIQGMLDGNWLGDPIHAGAWRWYPPLFHALAAGAAALGRFDLLAVWVHAGVWLNLAVPLCFYVMAQRLVGRWPAVLAAYGLTLAGGALMSADEAALYTPMTLTPALGWPLFFLGVWFIVGEAPKLRWRGAVLSGVILGIVFLAHTVPAVLLSAIAATVVVTSGGPPLRMLAWLAVAAGLELALGAVFLLPLLLEYGLRIANPVPGAWVHYLLQPPSEWRLLLLNLPGVLALPLLATLARPAAAALGAWIALASAFLLRHFACAIAGPGSACSLLPIAPHHFQVYLQPALACLVGLALWRIARWLPVPAAAALGVVAAVAGFAAVLALEPDGARRDMALDRPDLVLDRAAYRWILESTGPRDLFVTPLPAEWDRMGGTVATVFATGRRLVAPPEVHSNPYLAWAPMNASRLDYLRFDPASLCRFANEAGSGATAWFLLPNDAPAPPLPPAFRSPHHTLYRVDATQCDSRTP